MYLWEIMTLSKNKAYSAAAKNESWFQCYTERRHYVVLPLVMWLSVCLTQSEKRIQLIVQFRWISQRFQPFSHTWFHGKQHTIDLLMNAYPKLHTQLPNSWSIITESTYKPCECLYWHCTVCSLVYNSFKSCRACITTQPCTTDIHNKTFQWNTSDHYLIRNLSSDISVSTDRQIYWPVWLIRQYLATVR